MEKKKYVGPGGRFQTRITLYLLLFSCIPVLVLWLMQQTMTSRILKNEMVSRKQTEFMNFSRQLDELVDQQKQNLEQFVQDEDVRTFLINGEADVYRVNYKLQLAFGAERERLAVYVIPRGKLPATGTQTVPDYYLHPYNDLDWGIFRKANQTADCVIHLNERRGSNSTNTIFSIARNVVVGGVVAGTIIIDITDAAIAAILSEDIAEKGNTVYLFDDWGFVCYSSGDNQYNGRDGLPDYITDTDPNLAETTMPDGTPVGLLRQQNHSTGLTILGEVPFYHIAETMNALNQTVCRLLFICTLLSILAAILTAKEMVGPLNVILKSIKSIQQADFTRRIGSGRKDEFGTVMAAFDEMSEKLIQYMETIEEKQKNLRLAEMKNLQAQIRPHFLYNTLDLIKWNIRLGEEERAVTMLTNLGKLLRSTIDFSDYVTVEEEIDIARRYLEIQTVHYNGNLAVTWELADNIGMQVIPKLILQPVVENSVIHGLSPSRPDNRIVISCRQKDDYLIFHVKDNGTGLSPDQLATILDCQAQSDSIGISNVHSRLVLFGDENCGIFFQSCQKGASVILICKVLKSG